ncbi:hypothetical protein BD779DRAFT_1519156 [Infundibulicybe gibba]|nr:hypothetical protein BD779DRAFT_1519156 [Infundibulicybe gibba]
MEAHPAHTSLPPGAHQDAIDALHWASTNELLPSHHSTAVPFTREECQSLTALLQSIERRGETPLRTLTVAKILLKVVRWRQTRPRSDQPLSVNVDRDGPRGGTMALSTAIALALSITFVQIAGIGVALLLLFLVESNFDVAGIVKYRRSAQREQTPHQSTTLSQATHDPPVSTVPPRVLYYEALDTDT